MRIRQSHGRIGWVLTTIALAMVFATLTRVVVFCISDHGPAGVLTLSRMFGAGIAYDLLVAMWLALPVVIYLTLLSPARYARDRGRRLRRIALAGFIAFVTFNAVAEVVFFDEFDGRFNFVAVDYLVYPTEVVTNIWQSYPLAWVIGGLVAFTLLMLWLLRRVLADYDRHDETLPRTRWTSFVGYVALLATLTLTISPRLSRVSDDRVINEVASSGYFTFWQAVLGRDAAYEGWYATRPDAAVTARLAGLVGKSRGSGGQTTSGSLSEPPLNVVLVLEESFGSTFVGALHPRDSASITPAFDSLTSEGLLLTHAYSTGNRTVRAIEAVTSSLPPLPGISIVRRAQSMNLFTLPSVLHANGYSTHFLYGGRALFDGMGSYARDNGFAHTVEQKDFPSGTFATAWGVSDEALFDRALTEFDSLQATGAPFFAMVLTVSNHKPYTYPPGRIPQNPDEHRRTFAVRYADWALGRFMQQAKSHAFYEHTLFVLLGDHGARVYGAAEIPLPSYEVPILFIKPGLVPAGARYDPIASSMDLPPTILGLLGITGDSKFLGRDLFGADTAAGRALMTHNNQLALMRGDRIAVLGLRGSTSVHALDANGVVHRVAVPTAADSALMEDAIAYFQGADKLYRSGAYLFDSTRVPRRR